MGWYTKKHRMSVNEFVELEIERILKTEVTSLNNVLREVSNEIGKEYDKFQVVIFASQQKRIRYEIGRN